jgi:hypothetical protein
MFPWISRDHVVAVLAVLVGGSAMLGCSGRPAGPPTVEVKGKLVITQGANISSLYNREGAIEFESVEQPGTKAYGELQHDGSFTLTTHKDGVYKNGVVEGNHRVRLLLDEQAAQFVHPQFLEFATSPLTAKVPDQREIVLQVWR